MQSIVTWELPIVADNRRSLELRAITRDPGSLALELIEEDECRCWRLTFRTIQAFRWVTEECIPGSIGLATLPAGSLLEVRNSGWIRQLGVGHIDFLDKSRHFMVFCYDELVEVVAWSFDLEDITPSDYSG